jgi:hypothetical protein
MRLPHNYFFIGILRYLQNGTGSFIAIKLLDKLRQNIKI